MSSVGLTKQAMAYTSYEQCDCGKVIMRSYSFLIILVAGLAWSSLTIAQERRRPQRAVDPGGARAKVEFYKSTMDGKRRPYGICATGDSDHAKPLIVHLQPGLSETVHNASRAFQQIERVIDIARRNNIECIAIRPTGRGPGSLFQNYGEVDALEAIEDVCAKHAVDRNRITLFGHSMGGAAVFYMVSHYPDRFAGAVPMSGYCDYRLWRKPGGYTFHMPPWEEPSWQARSAALLVDNFQHTPVWIMHGAWDRGVGSGVSVEHSRQMHGRLMENGFSTRYTEVPQAGHHFLDDQLFESAVLWMLDQKKQLAPQHVRFSTYSLRHNNSYWVAIEQFQQYGKVASVDANITDSNVIVVQTTNVRMLLLGPIAECTSATVQLAGQAISKVDLTRRQIFVCDNTGHWKLGQFGIHMQKHHGCAGPIGDVFHEKTILVSGSTGTHEENHFTLMAAYNLRNQFRKTNGGLHRGGIQGENSVILPYALDTELSDEEIRTNNLLLFGTPATHRLVKRFEDSLPLEFGSESVKLGGKTFQGDQVTVFAIFPHPQNNGRYVAVHGGVTPDATTFGSHLNVLLLPDYIVYDGPKVLDWGFFNNQWKPSSQSETDLLSGLAG